MFNPIGSVGGLPPLPGTTGARGTTTDGPSFEAMFAGLTGSEAALAPKAGAVPNLAMEGIRDVVSLQRQADAKIESYLTGGAIQPAEVLTTMQKADMALRLMLQVRNKLVQAYQQIQDIRI